MFFENGTCLWYDIFLVVKVPISLHCLPVAIEGPCFTATFNFPDLAAIEIPRVTALTPPDVFTGESTCLLDRIAKLNIGLPKKCIFAKKKSVESGSNGWKCHYDGTFRPFLLPAVLPYRKPSNPSQHPKEPRTNVEAGDGRNGLLPDDELRSLMSTESDASEGGSFASEANSDDDRADDLAFWFNEEKSDGQARPSKIRTSAPGDITTRPRLPSNQYDSIFDDLVKVVDSSKYAVLVNTLDAIVTIRWKPSEMSEGNWAKYTKAKRYIETTGQKKLSASCSSSLTVYTVSRIKARIQQWCAWHSCWVYEIRPLALSCEGSFVLDYMIWGKVTYIHTHVYGYLQ